MKNCQYANIIVALSNLYGLRVVGITQDQGAPFATLVLGCAILASVVFHLLETEEIRLMSFGVSNDRVTLCGFLGPSHNFLAEGMQALVVDRIFALASVGLTLHHLYSDDDLVKSMNWTYFFGQMVACLATLIYSDLICADLWMFATVHSIFHILIFDLALRCWDTSSHLFHSNVVQYHTKKG